MIVVLADEQRCELADGLDRFGKFAALALEFRGLAGAVSEDNRRT
jgi:hypothetical protein